MDESVVSDALLHCFFEVVYRPYILELYVINILFLSFSHISIYPHLFSILLYDLESGSFLYAKNCQLLQRYD